MATNTLVSAAVRSVLFASAAAAVGFPIGAMAQSAPDQELEEIVVTGSLIPQNLNAPGIPISLVTAEDIAKSGVSTDVLDVLTKTQPAFYGGLNIGSENGNISSGSTNGGSQISLRNRATLVLINGRRAAISPVAASGGFNFVDVNMIPVSAIERVEVLMDGASATYGADAVGGVVNLILKSDYDGVEVGGRFGSDNGGIYTETSAYATMGTSSEKTNVTFSTEWFKSDPLFQKDRSWGRGIFRTQSFAGVVNQNTPAGTPQFYYLNPNLNAPPLNLNLSGAQLVQQGIYLDYGDGSTIPFEFDLADKPTMVLARERKSAVLAFDHEVNNYFQLFGDFLVSNTTTTSQLNAQPVSGTVFGSNPTNPFNNNDVRDLPPPNALRDDITARNRFVDFPRVYETDTTAWRGVLGFRGDIVGSWKYEVASNWNHTISNFRNANLIDAVSYNTAVGNGTYNPFARQQTPGVIEGMLGTQYRDYTSSLYGFDAKVFGDLFSLPAGNVQLAAGADTREEQLTYENDRLDQTGQWLQATPTLPFSAKFRSTGYFAEMRVPVFSEDWNVPGFYALDVTLAGRQENISTTDDDPFVPKFSLRWQPLGDSFAVRASYSESFVAPTLYELFGPTSQGFTASQRLFRYDANGNAVGTQVTPGVQYRSQGGSNTALEPSETTTWTVGLVWTPEGRLDGFEASIDYYNMDETDIVGGAPTTTVLQSVEALGPNSPFANLVKFGTSNAGELYFGTGSPVTRPGQITSSVPDTVWLSNSNINLGGVQQDGLDVRLAYSYDTDSWGGFFGALTGTYLLSYDNQALPINPPIDLVGVYHDDYGLFPEYRLFLNLGWTFGALSASLNSTYIPSSDDATFGEPSGDPCRTGNCTSIDSFNSWDVRVAYDFTDYSGLVSGLTLAAGINNFTDEEPPFIESEGNQSRDIGSYDPIGTFYYLEMSYKF
jgi:iron complex outermembrane receptor protein